MNSENEIERYKGKRKMREEREIKVVSSYRHQIRRKKERERKNIHAGMTE